MCVGDSMRLGPDSNRLMLRIANCGVEGYKEAVNGRCAPGVRGDIEMELPT